MGEPSSGDAALLAEISAFRHGFGHARALRDAVRDALVLVPLDDDDAVPVIPFGGINWVCVFTSELELARFLSARGAGDQSHRFHTVLGWRVLDDLLPAVPGPAGVLVDACGDATLAFPPVVEGAAP